MNSQVEELIAVAELTGDVALVFAALRAAEEQAEVLQSELTEFLDIGYSLERIANLSEKWSDSLVRQINEIARDALDRRSTDYADALRATDGELHAALVENAKLREALEMVVTDKAPAYHDCIDDGLPECAWCVARRALGGKP